MMAAGSTLRMPGMADLAWETCAKEPPKLVLYWTSPAGPVTARRCWSPGRGPALPRTEQRKQTLYPLALNPRLCYNGPLEPFYSGPLYSRISFTHYSSENVTQGAQRYHA